MPKEITLRRKHGTIAGGVVVDEAHLARQLLVTTRRVAQLTDIATEPLGVPRLQVLSLDERAAMAAVIWAELDRRGREHVTDGH